MKLFEHRKRYNDLKLNFVKEREAYLKAELVSLQKSYCLDYGVSVIQTSHLERFLLADLWLQVCHNRDSLGKFQLYGFRIGRGEKCRINKDEVEAIPTCFTYQKYPMGSEGYFDYILFLYGENSFTIYPDLETFKSCVYG